MNWSKFDALRLQEKKNLKVDSSTFGLKISWKILIKK